MNNARENILNHLRENREHVSAPPDLYLPRYGWDKQQKIDRLTERMQAVRTEVHRLPDGNWIYWLNRELPERSLIHVLVGNEQTGKQFAQQSMDELEVKIYEDSIESWKQGLFDTIDVSLTQTLGGIAESGSLMLWPDEYEPRLMSLVPPVHIALLDSNKIFENFAQAMQELNWADNMPTNALLISGPSKTADIEQTLAYGIHGPKQLIVLILG
jgi:L-lactate dehydrogenase complex protein LldG